MTRQDLYDQLALADTHRYPCVEHKFPARRLLWLVLWCAWRSVLEYTG
jgi:hypothetical protein